MKVRQEDECIKKYTMCAEKQGVDTCDCTAFPHKRALHTDEITFSFRLYAYAKGPDIEMTAATGRGLTCQF